LSNPKLNCDFFGKRVTIKNQKGPRREKNQNQSTQLRWRVEGELPLGFTKSTGAKNIVFAPSVLEIETN